MIHPKVSTNSGKIGELLCAIGAAAFVGTGCWMGYTVAINGVLTHGLCGMQYKHIRYIVTYDLICNTLFTIIMLTVREYWPVSLFILSIVVAAFSISCYITPTYPLGGRLIHVLFVQVPSFVAIYVWCDCCSSSLSIRCTASRLSTNY